MMEVLTIPPMMMEVLTIAAYDDGSYDDGSYDDGSYDDSSYDDYVDEGDDTDEEGGDWNY